MESLACVALMRDEEPLVEGFLTDYWSLRWPGPKQLWIVTGDNTDGTLARLSDLAWRDPGIHILLDNRGAKKWGSVIDGERFRHMSRCWNVGIEAGLRDQPSWLLLLPGDHGFPENLALSLRSVEADIVAPLVLRWGRFYDTWAFHDFDGKSVSMSLPDPAAEPIQMASVGTPILIRERLLTEDDLRFGDEEAVGLCMQARGRGYRVFMDPRVASTHREKP